MKKLLLLAATACLLWACAEQNPPENPQTPTPEPEPQENKMADYFINPVAWNGAFVEVSAAFIGLAPDTEWPTVLTVNYGDSAIGADGLEHSGSLRINATNRFETAGAVITPDFTDFRVYGSSMSGRQTITNTGLNTAGHLVYAVTVEDGRLGGGQDFIYSETTQRELIAGLGGDGLLLPDLNAHQYSITGQMQMQSRADSIPGYEVTVDSLPMIISMGELYPIDGLMNIELDRPIEYEMNMENLQGKVAIQTIDLRFTGKTASGNYGAELTISVQMGFITVPFTIQCELNESGLIPESIQYKLG